ncbi:hypothetical protein HYC85_011266 [Camellia sinensis]|uniref:Uncharacterized protein n=1 Tax=Camellia sinensis TaxID=4442 RepID=A0A7J7H8L0_CAMSI|nr:hypothetical protein HYC85_011266 [Camellia sinensis]
MRVNIAQSSKERADVIDTMARLSQNLARNEQLVLSWINKAIKEPVNAYKSDTTNPWNAIEGIPLNITFGTGLPFLYW